MTEQEKTTLNLKDKDEIWVAYNHMPYGHVCATRFMTYKRNKRVGGEGETKEITITAEEQYRGFVGSEYVATFIGGKLQKKSVVTYLGPESKIKKNPRAANEVMAWAIQGGLEPYFPPSEIKKDDRVDTLEKRTAGIEASVVAIAESLKSVAEAISKIGHGGK